MQPTAQISTGLPYEALGNKERENQRCKTEQGKSCYSDWENNRHHKLQLLASACIAASVAIKLEVLMDRL